MGEATDATSAGEITVLHVDDDAQFRSLAKTCLERADPALSVYSEPSADDGLEQLRRRDVDCVVSDYDMGDTDGLEFLDAVRAEDASVPFVLYTGKGSEEIAADAVNAGVDAYHQKEVGTGQYTVLANHITTLVEKYRAERRLRYLERETHIADGGTGAVEEAADERPDSVSMRVVREVAAREGVDPVALAPPFGEVVNPDALDALFAAESTRDGTVVESVTLTYRGYTVTIDGDGRVSLDE